MTGSLTDTSIGFNNAGIFSVADITPFTPSNTECPGAGNSYKPIIDTIIRSPIHSATDSKYDFTERTANTIFRNDKGLLTPAALTGTTGAMGTYPNGLIKDLNICADKTLPTDFDNTSINACNLNDTVFIRGVQFEYEYYYARYYYAIQNLSSALQCTAGVSFGTYTRNNAITNYTNAAIVLNMMVNDIIYVMDQIAQMRTDVDISTLTTVLNAADRGLLEQTERLQKQRKLLLSSGQDKMVLFKEMETYSLQKSQYHNNMLMLYSFLNITALGLLFYVYRST